MSLIYLEHIYALVRKISIKKHCAFLWGWERGSTKGNLFKIQAILICVPMIPDKNPDRNQGRTSVNVKWPHRAPCFYVCPEPGWRVWGMRRVPMPSPRDLPSLPGVTEWQQLLRGDTCSVPVAPPCNRTCLKCLHSRFKHRLAVCLFLPLRKLRGGQEVWSSL